MLLSMHVEQDVCTVQPSSNSRKRKITQDHYGSNAFLDAKRPLSFFVDSTNTKILPQRNPKRLRLKQSSSLYHRFQSNTIRPPKDDLQTPIASLLLRPCHICWRRPTTRAVLDGYADCEACGSRTCYICLRECENDNCKFATADIHEEDVRSGKIRKRRLCSLCVVEHVDSDGADMIQCLECADLGDKGHQTGFTSEVQPP